MKKKYLARKNGILKDKDAQNVGELLDSLRNEQGYLKTQAVLDDAKDKNSPLHKYFEWDIEKSANKWRLQQARNIIGSVVEIVIIQKKEMPQRSFHSVQTQMDTDNKGEGKVYITIQDAIENDNYRKQLITKIITSLENLTFTMKMFREQDVK